MAAKSVNSDGRDNFDAPGLEVYCTTLYKFTFLSPSSLYYLYVATDKMARGRHRREEQYESLSPDAEEDAVDAGDGPPTIDPYEVLGLDTEATEEDVKKAYRKAALANHPGKSLSLSVYIAQFSSF